ncbi:MAG: hypothetical protein PHF23_08995 [Smithellaceae bacterium]|nr:hypothetical protein [Smithellaceae bacterium]
MVEILNPGLIDIRPVFETEFREMASLAVTCEELEETRKTLIAKIANDLTLPERQFPSVGQERSATMGPARARRGSEPAGRPVEASEYRTHGTGQTSPGRPQTEGLPGCLTFILPAIESNSGLPKFTAALLEVVAAGFYAWK